MTEPLVDARGLICPLPVLRTRKALKALPVGGTLRLLATDPASESDVRAFCEQAGHELLEFERDGEVLRYRLRRGR